MQEMTLSIRKQYLALIKACWRFSGKYKKRLFLIYGLFLIANICLMFQPWLIGELINTLQKGGDNLIEKTLFWLGMYVISMALFWFFHGPSRIIERKLAFYIKRNFNLHYYNIVSRMSVRWHKDHHSGNTINRINKASQAIFDFAGSQFQYAELFVRSCAIFIALALVDIYVCIAVFIYTFLMVIILNRFDKFIMKKIHAVNEKEHVFSAYKFDFISNIYNVITFNLRSKTSDTLKEKLNDIYPPYVSQVVLNEWKWFILAILIVLGHFGILLFYIWYHLQPGQILMLGTLVTIFQYLQRLDTIFFAIASLYLRLVQTFVFLKSVDPIEKAFESEGTVDDDFPKLEITKGQIHFDDLTFGYNNQETIFKNLTLKIAPQEKIGLIGPSGAGKSSLVNLLLRFTSHEKLNIKIDNQNIYEVSARSLRENIALIPQDTDLFQDTLLENIRYGRLEASDEEVIKAAKKANAHEFIKELPDTYKTLVGERGIKLSGGQRQRIAIARAILKDAPILILDEATSALDTESEKLIQESLKKLMAEKTVIAIAHRLSTISHLDRLIVMEKGKIIEDGSHNELLQKDGLYAKLWKMQSGGFIGG